MDRGHRKSKYTFLSSVPNSSQKRGHGVFIESFFPKKAPDTSSSAFRRHRKAREKIGLLKKKMCFT